MGQALDVHRLRFAFTITFHYIFPQLTMGLALLLVYLKTRALRTGDEHYDRAARFLGGASWGSTSPWGWSPAFPWSFSLGTNWAAFSKAGRRRNRPQRWRWRACFSLFSGVELPPDCFNDRRRKNSDASATGSRLFWFFWVRGSRDFSSSRRTPGCNIRRAQSWAPTAPTNSPASGICC